MNWIIKLMDMFGGLNGIKDKLSGKKTYTSAVAAILITAGYMVYLAYQFGEKEIDANNFYSEFMVGWGILSTQVTFVFHRMAQAKVEKAIKSQPLPAPDPNVPIK